ncbi:MAG TPA: vitamin K epoxide reductase family protein [Trebonia sp.]|nr:vitamin K epoxide reductase family protein [Trebonia sp.]
MASSKARSKNRSRSSNGGRSAAGAGSNGRNPSSRTVPAVSATPTSPRPSAGAAAARSPKRTAVAPEPEETFEPAHQAAPPFWVQIVSFVLAIIGLAISAYETYAHYNGNKLLGCPSKGGGTFNCAAVITSSQSMVFNVLPVAVLGLAFYVFAVVIFSPWAWRFSGAGRIQGRDVNIVRLGSVIVGMGFVMYLIYAEFQIGSVCEYCSGVHVVTFLLFCITVVSAALWGLGKRNTSAARS